jgi:hypothetical protein
LSPNGAPRSPLFALREFSGNRQLEVGHMRWSILLVLIGCCGLIATTACDDGD